MILSSCFNDLSNNWDPLNDVKEPTVEYLTWTADMCTGTKKKGPSPKKKKTKVGGKLVGREKNGKKSSSLSEEERAGLKKRMASRINMLKQSTVKQSNVKQSNVKIVVVRVAGGGVSDDDAAAPADEDGAEHKQKNLTKKKKREKQKSGSKKMSAKVVAAIATIKTHIVELQAEVDTHGPVPSPELSAVAARQAADAVGSTLCVIKSLEQQLAEANEKVGGWGAVHNDPILKPLERDLAAAETTLKAAVEVCATKWNLEIEAPFQAAVDNQATFAALPMSVPEKQGAGSDATMIGVIGSLYLLKGETYGCLSCFRKTVPPAWMFAAFARKRVAESTALVKMILRDVDLYNNALSVQIELPDGAAVVAKLAEATSDDAIRHQAVAGGSASSTGTVTEAWIKQTAAAASASATAPDLPLDSLAYVAHARLAAGPVSIKLYEVVSELLHAAHSIVGAECVPGMVKGAPRIVFKSMTKYGGNTSKCHDLARATVSVRTLADVVVVVLAVLACPLIVVIRIKNRMDPAYDALPIGGYRDVQFQCLLQDSAGKWFYAELQINLVAMIAIKEGGGEGGGGHHAFDQARLIDAFSERTLRYNGKPSEVVFGMVRSGVLLALDLTNNVLGKSQAAALQGALQSAECRIRSLVLTYCEAGPAFGKALAGMLASGHLKLTVLKSVHFLSEQTLFYVSLFGFLWTFFYFHFLCLSCNVVDKMNLEFMLTCNCFLQSWRQPARSRSDQGAQ